VKHVNTRFPDDLYDEMAEAANAEERPVGAWLRIAAKEKLARDKEAESRSSLATRLDGRPLLRDDVSPNFKKGGKK
jgi:hypothetical protein